MGKVVPAYLGETVFPDSPKIVPQMQESPNGDTAGNEIAQFERRSDKPSPPEFIFAEAVEGVHSSQSKHFKKGRGHIGEGPFDARVEGPSPPKSKVAFDTGVEFKEGTLISQKAGGYFIIEPVIPAPGGKWQPVHGIHSGLETDAYFSGP